MQVLAHVLFKSTMRSILVSRKLWPTKKEINWFSLFFHCLVCIWRKKRVALSQLLMEKYMRDAGSGACAFSEVQ